MPLMGSGLALSSQVTTLGQLYLLYGILAGVGTSALCVPFMSAITKWFNKRRGIVVGISLSESGFGSFCAAPLGCVIVTDGWRSAFLIAGTVAFLIIISVGLVIKDRPEEMGLKPYSEDPKDKLESQGQRRSTKSVANSYSVREVLRRKGSWLLYVLWTFSTIVVSIYNHHIVLFSNTIGIASTTASIALGTIGGRRYYEILLFCVFLSIVMSAITFVLKSPKPSTQHRATPLEKLTRTSLSPDPRFHFI
jgi:sugar phosphate permease